MKVVAQFSDARLENLSLKLLSLALLLAALAFAWVPHTHSAWWSLGWSWWGYSLSQVSFTPDFISGLLALMMMAPLYARGIVPYPHHSIANVVFFVVNLALTATFIQIALGKGGGFGAFATVMAITCAILLSWLGMRAVAGLAWLALLGFSVASALASNYSWGLAGFGFVVCGFCGVLLQSPYSPNGLMIELMHEYSLDGRTDQSRAERLAQPARLLPRDEPAGRASDQAIPDFPS